MRFTGTTPERAPAHEVSIVQRLAPASEHIGDPPRLVVVVPIGPRCRPEFVADTLDSIGYYSPPETGLRLLDDSGRGTTEAFVARERTEVILTRWRGAGGRST